ncbi:MAG: YraN family protein [Patescibacteria group bacterium]|nr:YraN family protein [Patescibacteria group bacterium]
MAAVYLKSKGHKILAKNFRRPWGEIDLISTSPDGVLVFTEIKSTLAEEGGRAPTPFDHMGFGKMRSLRRSAEFFANKFSKLSEKGWRIDFISVTIPEGLLGKAARYPNFLLTELIKCCEVEVCENIA